jgi:hypothetical protein
LPSYCSLLHWLHNSPTKLKRQTQDVKNCDNLSLLASQQVCLPQLWMLAEGTLSLRQRTLYSRHSRQCEFHGLLLFPPPPTPKSLWDNAEAGPLGFASQPRKHQFLIWGCERNLPNPFSRVGHNLVILDGKPICLLPQGPAWSPKAFPVEVSWKRVRTKIFLRCERPRNNCLPIPESQGKPRPN